MTTHRQWFERGAHCGRGGRNISGEMAGINMALENHYSVYYVTSFLRRSGRQSRAYKCLAWLRVGFVCAAAVVGVLKNLTENTRRAGRLRRGGAGWHNE